MIKFLMKENLKKKIHKFKIPMKKKINLKKPKVKKVKFEDEDIPENESFFLEVKASMAELTDLLRQIKEISKVVNNTSENLPKYVIGIICKFNESQIKFQQKELDKKYKKNGKDTFFKYVMEKIKANKIKVLIGAIKDQKVFEYPLGIDDFLIEGERLKKRIDIISI